MEPSLVSATEKAVFGCLYCSLAVFGLLCNGVLFYIFTKDGNYRKLSFYCIARQVIVSDLVACIIHLYAGSPSTFYERNIYSSYPPLLWFFHAMLFVELAAHTGTIIFVLLMAIHRLVIFTMPVAEKVFFQGSYLILWIIVAWVYVAIETLGLALFGCQKVFSFTQYFFYWKCEPGTFSSEFSRVFILYLQIAVAMSYVYPTTIFALNCAVILIIYCRLKDISFGESGHKREVNMLVQTFCLCAVIMLQTVSFNVFGSISRQNQDISAYLTLCQNLISVATCMLHPLTYLAFNKQVMVDSLLPESERTAFTVLYCVIAVSALFCNAVLFHIFTKDRNYRKLSFYCIARHVIVSDIVACIIHLYAGAPSTFFERNIYSSIPLLLWLFDAMLFVELTAHNETIIFVLLMAIHRLVIFTMPVAEKIIFHGKYLIIWIITAWIYVAVNSLGLALFGCQKVFSLKKYFFFWECTPGTFSSEFFKIAVILSYVYPASIFVLNCAVILIISCQLKNFSSGDSRHRKREINMLVQTFCLCAVIVLQAASFDILGGISQRNQNLSAYLTLGQNLISVATCMLHPLTYIAFNGQVRRDFYLTCLQWKKNKKTVNQMNSVHTISVVTAI